MKRRTTIPVMENEVARATALVEVAIAGVGAGEEEEEGASEDVEEGSDEVCGGAVGIVAVNGATTTFVAGGAKLAVSASFSTRPSSYLEGTSEHGGEIHGKTRLT